MKIGFIKQNIFGGTDLLLGRAKAWLIAHGHICQFIDLQCPADFYDIIILPTSEIPNLYAYKKAGFKFKKILIWAMGHGAFSQFMLNDSFLRKSPRIFNTIINYYLKKLMEYLISSKSLIFTDEVGLNYELHKLSIKFTDVTEIIVPIALEKNSATFHSNYDRKSLRVAWLGRVSKDFKVRPLINLLKLLKLNDWANLNISSFTVIGSGDGLSYLKLEGSEQKIKFIEHVDYHYLSSYLNNNFDLVFAMGTSAINSAAAAVPTIIVNPRPFTAPLDEGSFRWIFDSIGFSLGEFDFENTRPEQPSMTFEELINSLKGFDMTVLSLKSREYAELFLEDNVFPMLEKKIYDAREIDIEALVFLIASCFSKLKSVTKSLFALFR
jgi:hypothetical protein